MSQAAEQIATLQELIDDVANIATTVHAVSGHAETPEPARKVLVGGLNYLLDLLDIFPDHYKGLGLADDVAVLCFAAHKAVELGANHAALSRAAASAAKLSPIFADLATPLERFVEALPKREVRGRTTDQIIASKDARAGFDADVKRAIAKLTPSPIEVAVGGPETALKELLKMTRSALGKAGLL